MSARQDLPLIAGFLGIVATLFFYLFLFFVQIQNAEDACESYTGIMPGTEFSEIRSIGFQNAYLNLGGRCEYRLENGSVVVTRKPGWWFSGTIASFVVAFAGVVAFLARWKGHLGLLYGLATLLAPPLGIALALAAARGPGGKVGSPDMSRRICV